MKAMRLPSILAPIALFAISVIACTAVVSGDSTQCESNADCTSRGPDFVGTVCSGGMCLPEGEAAFECTKSSDCAGDDTVCSDLQHKCVRVTSEDCSVEYGNPKEDGTVLFGLTSEIGMEDTFRFREFQHPLGAKLAFQDFFDAEGARFPGDRKAALITCSDWYPRRVAAHLANIGAKAIIGPSMEGRQRAFVETLLDARVPSISPWINSNPAAVLPNSQGLAWRTGVDRADVIAPLNALLAEHAQKLKDETGATSIRVAVLLTRLPFPLYDITTPFGPLMEQKLIFNGQSAAYNARDEGCGQCFRQFETSFALPDALAQRANEILDFRPDFIIPFTEVDWGSQLLPALEAQLPGRISADATFRRPTYLQPFFMAEEIGYKLLPVGDPKVRKRITGIRPIRDNSFEVFATKFRAAFRPINNPTELGPEPNPGAGRAYETALLMLFATHAALVEKNEILPEDVVGAFPSVTDPAAKHITLTDIRSGVQLLNSKQHIRVAGLFSSFDFDRSRDAANVRWTTWCVGDKGQYVSGSRVFDGASFGAPAFCQ